MPVERRAHRRVASSLDVLWSGLLTDNHALATDISLGGCYVETAGRADVGEPIALDMMLSLDTHLSLRGEVVHRQWPMGFGLRYVGLIGGERASISRLIEGGLAAPARSPRVNDG